MKKDDGLETKDALGFTATVLDEIYGIPMSASNKRVQLVLFFAHLLSLKKYGCPLLKDNFKAQLDDSIYPEES